jgi:predicted nucleic acid-binding protein
MVVVSNTSPLSNPAIIGRLGLVREQLGAVVVPRAVHVELGRNPNGNAHAALEAAIAENWIFVTALKGAVPEELVADLDIGEAEALARAVQNRKWKR